MEKTMKENHSFQHPFIPSLINLQNFFTAV